MALANELDAGLTPGAIAAYLATQGWAKDSSRVGVYDSWVLPTADLGETPESRLLLPTNRELRDFRRRLQEVVWGLQEHFGLTHKELVDQVAAVRADIFFLRLDQQTVNGTIPMRQANNLIEGAFRMMRAAATTTANPAARHIGRRPALVNDFLDEDLRMGHTRRGSFVLTIVARHTEEASAAGAAEGPEDPVEPFSRRVMTTLSRALSVTQRAVADEDDLNYFATEDLSSSGVSSELLQSILDVSEPAPVRALDLSFQWATGTAQPDVPARVIIPKASIPGIQELNERLQRRIEPERVTLFGRVMSLTREDGQEGTEDQVIILEADVGGRLRNVTVPLLASDYEWAIRAHQARLPFTVTGDLVRRRTWRLEGVVQADTEFLQHHFRST